MSKERQQSSIPVPFTASTTASSFATLSDTGGAGEDDKITLFAPFEAQKPPRALFYNSDEEEAQKSENRGSTAGTGSGEIEFQGSESQAPGSATVIFRKLRAAVSGGSTGPSSGNSSSLSASVSVSNKPSPLVQSLNFRPNQGSRGASRNAHPLGNSSIHFQKGQRSSASPTPSAGSTGVSSNNTDPSTATAGGMARNTKVNVEQSVEPRISLTSYSDPRGHIVRQSSSGGGGVVMGMAGGVGVVRPQAQAVNKSEMLKRFGSIADNQVQVCMHANPFEVFLVERAVRISEVCLYTKCLQ